MQELLSQNPSFALRDMSKPVSAKAVKRPSDEVIVILLVFVQCTVFSSDSLQIHQIGFVTLEPLRCA